MHVKLSDIAVEQKAKNSNIMRLNEKKCEGKVPGIREYLDKQFPNDRFEWNKPLNSVTIVHMITFLAAEKKDDKYSKIASEMLNWVKLSAAIRNPAAHTIISINEDMFRKNYGKKSIELCRSMQSVLSKVFGTEARKEAFEIYDIINRMIWREMERTSEYN